MNGEEVVDVSKKFNEYNLPLDVIWLDIEVINILLIYYSIHKIKSILLGMKKDFQMII
jgi:hypothetical protein